MSWLQGIRVRFYLLHWIIPSPPGLHPSHSATQHSSQSYFVLQAPAMPLLWILQRAFREKTQSLPQPPCSVPGPALASSSALQIPTALSSPFSLLFLSVSRSSLKSYLLGVAFPGNPIENHSSDLLFPLWVSDHSIDHHWTECVWVECMCVCVPEYVQAHMCVHGG